MKISTKHQVKLFRYILGLFLIGIGVVIGIAIRHFNNIPIAETIDIVDVATLATTIFLSLYIPEVLDRHLTILRDKKHLIEERIETFQAYYRRVNLLVQKDSVSDDDILTIKNYQDVCTHKLDTIATLLLYLDKKNPFKKDLDQLKKLDKEHKTILSEENIKEGKYLWNIKEREEFLFNEIDKISSLLIFKTSNE